MNLDPEETARKLLTGAIAFSLFPVLLPIPVLLANGKNIMNYIKINLLKFLSD